MSTLTELKRDVESLTPQEKYELNDYLLASLENQSPGDVRNQWLAEATAHGWKNMYQA
jgi:hypothetical protein